MRHYLGKKDDTVAADAACVDDETAYEQTAGAELAAAVVAAAELRTVADDAMGDVADETKGAALTE